MIRTPTGTGSKSFTKSSDDLSLADTYSDKEILLNIEFVSDVGARVRLVSILKVLSLFEGPDTSTATQKPVSLSQWGWFAAFCVKGVVIALLHYLGQQRFRVGSTLPVEMEGVHSTRFVWVCPRSPFWSPWKHVPGPGFTDIEQQVSYHQCHGWECMSSCLSLVLGGLPGSASSGPEVWEGVDPTPLEELCLFVDTAFAVRGRTGGIRITQCGMVCGPLFAL